MGGHQNLARSAENRSDNNIYFWYDAGASDNVSVRAVCVCAKRRIISAIWPNNLLDQLLDQDDSTQATTDTQEGDPS
jgi:hypothetical protein